MQTFPDYYYKNGIPLDILSDWGWHSFPNPDNYTLKDAFRNYNVHGRIIAYPTDASSKAGKWLRENPQRLPLGVIGFDLKKPNGSKAKVEDIKNIFQKLDLWKGIIKSKFEFDNRNVSVVTVCNPNEDFIGVHVKSSLMKKGQLSISIKFPYAFVDSIKNNPPYNWNPNLHTTQIVKQEKNFVKLERKVDTTNYFVYINWSGNLTFKQEAKQYFKLIPGKNQREFSFIV